MHALEIALRAAGCRDAENARVIRIRDTLHLSDILVSAPVLSLMRDQGLDVGEAALTNPVANRNRYR